MMSVYVQAASSANRSLVLYQYNRPTAMPHLAVALFQLRDVWGGGAVEIGRRCRIERSERLLFRSKYRGACLNMIDGEVGLKFEGMDGILQSFCIINCGNVPTTLIVQCSTVYIQHCSCI